MLRAAALLVYPFGSLDPLGAIAAAYRCAASLSQLHFFILLHRPRGDEPHHSTEKGITEKISLLVNLSSFFFLFSSSSNTHTHTQHISLYTIIQPHAYYYTDAPDDGNHIELEIFLTCGLMKKSWNQIIKFLKRALIMSARDRICGKGTQKLYIDLHSKPAAVAHKWYFFSSPGAFIYKGTYNIRSSREIYRFFGNLQALYALSTPRRNIFPSSHSNARRHIGD